ncbi:hypothetical protein HRbin12_00146 [bacterium HR12]|nr:hypothetical protein HRbin12_00146 [bacterium HR12]
MVVGAQDGGHGRNPVLRQAHVERGTAHIERDHTPEPVPPGERQRPGHAGRGPRQDQAVGLAVRAFRRHAAPVGLHHEEGGVHPELPEAGRRPTDVAPDDRTQGGVDDRRGGARILAELAGNLGGQRHRHLREPRAEGSPDRAFVTIVQVAEEERHGHRLRRPGGRLFHDPVDLLRRQGDHDLAEAGEPLPHLDAVPPGNHLVRARLHEVVELRPAARPVAEDVPEALRGEQHHPGSHARQHGVRRDGGAVEEQVHPVDTALAEPTQAVEETDRRVGGRRGHLRHPELAVRGHRDAVGEGPPDVDPHDPPPCRHPSLLGASGAVARPPPRRPRGPPLGSTGRGPASRGGPRDGRPRPRGAGTGRAAP